MPTFGPYTVARRLRSDGVSETWIAQQGTDGPEVELRLFLGASAADSAARPAALDALEAAWIQADLCAAGAGSWTPVVDFGAADSAPFVATAPCDLTAEDLIRARAAGDERRLWDVITGVLDGLIEIETLAGRPHGALSPAAVRLTLRPQDRSVTARLSGPAPASSLNRRRARAADLRAVGELIVRLATGMEAATLGGWPLPEAAGWRRLHNGDGWRTLANTLLDPAADTGASALREARQHAERLKPASQRRRLGAAAAAVALVGILVATLLITSPWREIRGKPASFDELVELIEMNENWSTTVTSDNIQHLHPSFKLALEEVANRNALRTQNSLPERDLLSALEILRRAGHSDASANDLLALSGIPANSPVESDQRRLDAAEGWLNNDATARKLGRAHSTLKEARQQTLDAITAQVKRLSELPHGLPAERGLLSLLRPSVEASTDLENQFVSALEECTRAIQSVDNLNTRLGDLAPHRDALEQDDLLAPFLDRIDDWRDTLSRSDSAQPPPAEGAGDPLDETAVIKAALKTLGKLNADAQKLAAIAGTGHQRDQNTFDDLYRAKLESLEQEQILDHYLELASDLQGGARIPPSPDPREASRTDLATRSEQIEGMINDLAGLGNTEGAATYEQRLGELAPPEEAASDDPWALPWVNLHRAEIEDACADSTMLATSLEEDVRSSVAEATGDRDAEIAAIQPVTFSELLASPDSHQWLPAAALAVDSPAIEDAWTTLRDQVIEQEPRGVYGMRRGLSAAAAALVALDSALAPAAAPTSPGIDAEVATAAINTRREQAIRAAAGDLQYRKDAGRSVPFAPAESADVTGYDQWRQSAGESLQRTSAVYTAATALSDLTDRAPDPAGRGEDLPLADLWRLAQGSETWDALSPAAGQARALVAALEALPATVPGDAGSIRELLTLAREAEHPTIAVAAWRRAVRGLEALQLDDLDLMLKAREHARQFVASHAPERSAEFDEVWNPACSRAWQGCLEGAADQQQIAAALGAAPRLFGALPAHDSEDLGLTGRSRFNLLLAALRAEESQKELRALETAEAQARVRNFLAEADRLGAPATALEPLQAKLAESESEPGDADAFDADAFGPDARWVSDRLKGERLDEDDPMIRRYRMPWDEILTFHYVQPEDSPAVFLCATETTTETFAAILNKVAQEFESRSEFEAWLYEFQSEGAIPGEHEMTTTWRLVEGEIRVADASPEWTWVNIEHTDVSDLANRFGEERLYANGVERRNQRHPINKIGQALALGVASKIGCRIPAPAEFVAALKMPGALPPVDEQNLRDQRFAAQRELVSKLIRDHPVEGGRDPAFKYPDEGAFRPSRQEQQEPRRERADAQVAEAAPDDGAVYPWPVPTGPAETGRFVDLIGNVAEWVCAVVHERDDDGEIHPPSGPLTAAHVDRIVREAFEASGASGVIGRSALSCPVYAGDARAVYRALPFQGYADVGFRLAFTAGPQPLGDSFAYQVKTMAYVPPPP